MIYVCNHCGLPINELRTLGDDVNKDLICPKCAKEIEDLLKNAKKIQLALLERFQLIT